MVGHGAAPSAASPLRPGLVLGGRYRLLARLGAGGMGEVWRAEHTSLGTPAAVKIMDTATGADVEERVKRFHQEARAAAHLRSHHIVQILDHGVEGRFAFIVMELLEGEGLDHRLARAGRLTPAETARVIAGMARGLSRAHEAGVLHRDLKPANVFLTRDAGGEVVKLLDFGIAKVLGARPEQVLTHQGNIVGTPSYMSPEQIRGGEIDSRSDLWQLGVIAFECLIGTRPFDGSTLGDTFMRICTMPLPAPSSLAPVPPGFDAWVARALHRDPARRFSSAKEMAAALLLILTPGEGDALVTSSTGIRSGIRTGRHAWSGELGGAQGRPKRWWIAVAVAGVAAVATAGLLSLWQPTRQGEGTPSAAASEGPGVPTPLASSTTSAPSSTPAPPAATPSSATTPGPSATMSTAAPAGSPPGPSVTAPPSRPPVRPAKPPNGQDPLGI